MADPVLVACPADVWTKVASNVTSGQVHTKDSRPGVYLQTYRGAGGVAPTLQSEGVQMAPGATVISALAGIDVYVWAAGVAGKVRVDL